jgi:LPXTG-motif cell wall-anchored protein
MKKIALGTVAAALVAAPVAFFVTPSAAVSGCPSSPAYDQLVIDSEPFDELVIDSPAVPATEGTPAVTHTVHHDAVEAVPAKWWNWSPNKDQGPFEGPPSFPTDERGTWEGPHTNGGPDQDTTGTFNSSNGESGRASWFHREAGTPGVDAYDEVVIDTPAVPGTPAIPAVTHTVHHDGQSHVVHHPAVVCDTPKPTPVVTPKPTPTPEIGHPVTKPPVDNDDDVVEGTNEDALPHTGAAGNALLAMAAVGLIGTGVASYRFGRREN